MSELVHNTLDSYRYQLEQRGFLFEEKIDEVRPCAWTAKPWPARC